MPLHHRLALLAIASMGLLVGACTAPAAQQEPSAPAVVVEPIEGTALSRIMLSDKAAARLGVRTAMVVEEPGPDGTRTVIPHAAVLYDELGAAWAYAEEEPLSYVRHSITIDAVEGDRAILSLGPASGTAVVVVGAAELYGAESGVGGGH